MSPSRVSLDRHWAIFASLTALQLVGCTTTANPKPLDDVWENPARHDGKVFEATIYPFDFDNLLEDDAYTFCMSACSEERAARAAAYVVVAEPGRFRGLRGDRPVRMRMAFDAFCFTDLEAVCPHYSFRFTEVP